MSVVIINPNSTASMTAAMLDEARAAAPAIEFEGWTSTDGPPSIQGPEDGALATPPLLELSSKAVSRGADGIIIGCFDDTALAEIAARSNCPVIGIGQAAYHFAAMRHWRFSVVTTLGVSVPILEHNIESYGLRGFLGKVRASEIPVLDLENDPSASARRIISESRVAIEKDGIDAIILGCAGMVQVVKEVRRSLDIPVIDPVTCAAKGIAWFC